MAILRLPGSDQRKIEGAEKQSALIGPRCLTLTPGDPSVYWTHAGRPEMLQGYLRRSLFTGALEELYGVDASRADLLPRFAILDPLLEQLALAVISALQGRESGEGRLREFIEHNLDNLDKDLSLAAMGPEVLISPLYLPRAFKVAFGQSPHQYVLSRRIERAKELLRDTEMPVVDISFATGFSSQSHLSNLFLRAVGVSPAAYRLPYFSRQHNFKPFPADSNDLHRLRVSGGNVLRDKAGDRRRNAAAENIPPAEETSPAGADKSALTPLAGSGYLAQTGLSSSS